MSASDPVDGWLPTWGSFAEFFADEAIGDPGAPYLTELNTELRTRTEWTRSEWRAHVAATAAGLSQRGATLGDSVAVLAGNSADALAVAFACWTNGWVLLPLNANEPASRHEFILKHAKARILVHGAPDASRAADLGAASGVPVVLASNLSPAARESGKTLSLPALPDWESPALRVYTSGTTGEPKGVQLTAGNLIADADALAVGTDWDSATRVLVVLPIHHVNGLVVSCLQAWYVGGSIVLCDRFRSERFWVDIEDEGATVASLVPTLLEFLIEQGGDAVPKGFREVYCGAGPLMTETVVTFEERFGVPVRHLYGLSETTAVATMIPVMPETRRRAWYVEHGFPSVGRTLPHVDVQIHDPAGEPCPAGVRGEIVMRGATVMRGYADHLSATAEAIRDGWFHSGDEGFWQPAEDGTPFFFITGRLKELIIRGGVNISPFQVDEVLNTHPAVRFGLAIPFENRYYGEEIAAYVVRSSPVTEQEILDHCAERLDFAYRPKVVIFGDDVPFTATGKAKRLTLKQHLAEELARYRGVQFRRSHATTTAPVRVERRGHVLIITLSRPEARNALNAQVAELVAAAMDELDASPQLRVGVLTGAGGVFSAGMDLKAFAAGESPFIPGRGLCGITVSPPRKPLIAAVEGWALAGGFELLLACDLVVAAEGARFGLPEVKRGIVAAAGGAFLLSTRVPLAQALEMLLTGDPITASRAHEMGIVNRVTSDGNALAEAQLLADRIAVNAPLALEVSKQIARAAGEWGTSSGWSAHDSIARRVMESDDAAEGARAFAEKRDPVWLGR